MRPSPARRRLAGLVVAAGIAAASSACTSGSGRLDTAGPPSTGGDIAVDAGTGEAAFCAKVLDVLGRYKDAFADPTGGAEASDPSAALEQVKVMGTRLAQPMRELADAAPAEVGPALDTMARGFEAMASGDLTTMAGASGEMGAAGQQFGDYLATRCQSIGSSGLDAITGAFGAATPGAPGAPGTPPGQPTPAPSGTGPSPDVSGERGPYAPPSPVLR